MLIRLGRGIVARDRIGRAVGSAMWFPLGEDAASVGMVIVSPRLQDLGAGQWLMRTILAQTEGRRVVLNATAAAIRLYAALGFQPLGRVFQHQGFVSGAPLPQDGRVRPLAPGDAADAHALDSAASGAAGH